MTTRQRTEREREEDELVERLARADMTTSTTLNVRRLDVSAARTIKAGARARGLTIAQYLHRLALLHVDAREWAARDPEVAACLARLGLDTITI